MVFTKAYGKIFLLLFLLFVTCCCAKKKKIIHCEKPSSCGDITNISYPFRLLGDPENCGDPNYELVCERNTTVLYLQKQKYIVRSINYLDRTIRLVDDDVWKSNCSILPNYSLVSLFSFDPLSFYQPRYSLRSYANIIIFISCEHPANSSHYIDSTPCLNTTAQSPQKKRYSYVLREDSEVSDVKDLCSIEGIVQSSSPVKCDKNCSYLDVYNQMSYGIELSWKDIYCKECNHGNEYYWVDRCNINDNLTEFKGCSLINRHYYTLWGKLSHK
ncbi:hypothetical protein ACFE04_009331 [Oxalis oulophora]